MSHAEIARRVTLSHAAEVAPSGKSPAHFRASLLPHEGRFATVTDRWQWDAMGVCCCSVVHTARTNGDARTVKSCGPDIPMLISRVMRVSALRAWWPTSPAHQGDHEAAVKTVARGGPGVFGQTCGTCRLHFFPQAGHGGGRLPTFPAPSRLQRTDSRKARALQAARMHHHICVYGYICSMTT
jgi:hypothetical protein